MCAHVEISEIDEERAERIKEELEKILQPRSGNIGEPVRHVEFEPLPDAVPVTEPAAPAVQPEPIPA